MKTASVITIILILMITLLPACSCGEPGEAAIEDNSIWAKQLADKFSPIIYLNNDENSEENFEPAPVETMIGQTDIHATDNTSFKEKATTADMETYSRSNYFLDIPDISPRLFEKSIEKYIENYKNAKATDFKPTVYARVTLPGDSNPTVVQYWLFYYFDAWSNLHEGDWEMVELVFPRGFTAEKLVTVNKDIQPDFAAYSQHQAGQQLPWADMLSKGMISDTTHPKVYVGRGSHANYFTPGQFWLISDFDDTGSNLREIINYTIFGINGSNWREISNYQIIMIPGEDPGNKEKKWLAFQGGWGEYLDLTISWGSFIWTQSGPNGPRWSAQGKKSEKWHYPSQWAKNLATYPQVYFASFLPEFARNWPILAIFSIFSPADIYVSDGYGHQASLNKGGEFETQIPGASYITPEGPEGYVCKTIIIPNGDVSQNYKLTIKGTGVGTMDIKVQVPDAKNNIKRYLEYRDIPVTPTTTAILHVTETTPFTPPSDNSQSVRDNTTILEMDQDGDGYYEIKFKPGITNIVNPEHALTLQVEGAGIARATGGDTYKENDVAIITAEPEKGWVFDRWDGDYSGTAPSIRVVMDRDKTIIAYFKPEPKQFLLTINVEGKGITSSGPGTYFFAEGSQVSIQALLESMTEKGWVFDHWGGDASGTSPSLSVVMDRDKTIVAYFKTEVRQFSLTIGVEGKGTTSPGPGMYSFTEGSKVSIQALPERGYELAGWSGDYGNSPTLELTINRDISITATFRQIPVIDQSNEPPWEGGYTTISPKNKVGQTIVTQSHVLLAVDVNIITANAGLGGDNITMKILYNGEQIIASVSQFVPEGFDGWLRFEIKGGVVLPVETITTLVIQLEDTGKNVFGWKYAGDTYPSGFRFSENQAQKGDFFFRVYSAAGE